MRHFLATSLLLFSCAAHGTVQIPDTLVLGGERHILFDQPIATLLDSDPQLRQSLGRYRSSICSASWLGYRATWEIDDDRLFLTELIANPCADEPTVVPLTEIPGYRAGRVLASWVSGRLIVLDSDLTILVKNGAIVSMDKPYRKAP